MKKFDILILGGGVAGMTAGIYAKRRGKNVAIVEKFVLGGQVNSILHIENFPSQTEIDGLTLCQMFSKHIKALGVEIVRDDIVSVDLLGEEKVVTGKKETYQAKSVIIATGLSYVELGIGEDKFLGRGVSFCAVCDANFYKGKPVCVASKNGSGLKSAFELAEVCSEVTVLDAGDMSVYASANKNKKVKVVSNVKIEKVVGDDVVKGVVFEENGKEKQIETNALFVDLGKKPQTNLFDGIKLDSNGFIITDEKMQTSVKGVFAVGDVRSKELKQIVTACADGAIAGQFA